jgi:pilus assembly protein Flp/PilA
MPLVRVRPASLPIRRRAGRMRAAKSHPNRMRRKEVRSVCNCISVRSVVATRFWAEDGQTMAEYGILVGFIAVVVIAAAIILGSDISSLFSPVLTHF